MCGELKGLINSFNYKTFKNLKPMKDKLNRLIFQQ